jgi:hypothetical protein
MSGYEPLLTSDVNEAIPSPYRSERRERHVVFAIDDDEDDDDQPLHRYADDERSPRNIDGNFDGRRVAPPLRSTLRSREAGVSQLP